MSMKKVIILLLVVFNVSVFGQIEREIESYVDSTEIMVQKGRKLMLKELNENNIEKVKQVHEYLSALTLDKHFIAFYFIEDLYINLLARDWVSTEKLLVDYDKYKNSLVYPVSTSLVYKLKELTSSQGEQILKECNESDLDKQTKRVLELFLYHVQKGEADVAYNEMLREYKKEFDNQRYASFEDRVLPRRMVRASWSFSFGSGVLFATDKLADYYKNNAVFTMSMDVNFERLFTSLYINGTNLKLRKPFTAIKDLDTMQFVREEKFSFMDAGLKAGYFLIRNDRVNLSPFASISGSYLESTRYDEPRNNDLEYEVFNSFTYGFGLHAEFKLLEFGKGSNSFPYGGSSQNFLSIKIESGYNKMVQFKNSSMKGDAPYIVGALVFGFGRF